MKAERHKTKFTYGQHVTVLVGFYRGITGRVVEHRTRPVELGWGRTKTEDRYIVRFDAIDTDAVIELNCEENDLSLAKRSKKK